ncbi:hypothetical protein PO124_33230 [Bacillus licheniformis]|nr:hypothetical protein [Bacillus licheniformis]
MSRHTIRQAIGDLVHEGLYTESKAQGRIALTACSFLKRKGKK